MKTILVPLDGSTLAEQVLPTVRQLAPVLGARVHLLRVVPDLESERLIIAGNAAQTLANTLTPSADHVQETQRILTEQAAAYLSAQANLFRDAAIPVGYEVRMGDPAETILAVATQAPITLIALATHGYSDLRRWALGSVSDTVVHNSVLPVVVVRATDTLAAHNRPLERIMVPLDGSDMAEQALPHALDLARQTDAQIVLVTAIDSSRSTFVWSATSSDDPLTRLQAAANTALETIANALRRWSVAVRTSVGVGHPAEVIVNEAANQQASLIVMATHDRNGLRRWAAGSVADKVLHTTRTPLLLIRRDPCNAVDSSLALPRSAFTFSVRDEEPTLS